MPKNPTDKLLALVRELGVLRPRDLDAHGISRIYLMMAVEQKKVERAG